MKLLFVIAMLTALFAEASAAGGHHKESLDASTSLMLVGFCFITFVVIRTIRSIICRRKD